MLEPVPLGISKNPILECVGWVNVSFATFNLNYYSAIDIPWCYMSSIQLTFVRFSSCVNTPSGPCFLDLLLLVRWFDKDVRGIFQIWLAFHSDVKPFSTASITFSKAYVVHLLFKVLFVFVCFWPMFYVDMEEHFPCQ
jgi:hypothetical protein